MKNSLELFYICIVDLKRIANEQIMEKIKEIARDVYKEEKKKEMEELIKDVAKKEGTI